MAGPFSDRAGVEFAGTTGAAAGVAAVASVESLSPEQVRQSIAGKYVCPFCGSVNESDQGACPRCTMENSAASRKATKTRIGPWYVLQTRNPAAPGMKFETLLSFVRKGRVKPRSIVRGPTTHQLWKFAAQVKGLSREFGVCYSCGGEITTKTSLCPQCNRLQDAPANPDALLETSRESSVPPGTATEPLVNTPSNRGTSRPVEPNLDSADADFVVPALGNPSESMAGFSLGPDSNNGSMSGVSLDWARIDASRANSAPSQGHSAASPRSATPASSRNSSPRLGNTGSSRKPAQQGEGFISVKDLAAAFQLDFNADAPPAAPAAPGHRPPVAPSPPMDADAFFAAPRPQHKILRGMLLATILLAATAAVALVLDESLRHQVLQWVGQTRSMLSEPNPTPSGTTAPPTVRHPLAHRAASTPTPNVASPNDWSAGAAVPQTQPATQPAYAPMTDSATSAAANAMRLYREGIDAESRADWATAAARYRSIKAYPKANWASDLEARLKFAESQTRPEAGGK